MVGSNNKLMQLICLRHLTLKVKSSMRVKTSFLLVIGAMQFKL